MTTKTREPTTFELSHLRGRIVPSYKGQLRAERLQRRGPRGWKDMVRHDLSGGYYMEPLRKKLQALNEKAKRLRNLDAQQEAVRKRETMLRKRALDKASKEYRQWLSDHFLIGDIYRDLGYGRNRYGPRRPGHVHRAVEPHLKERSEETARRIAEKKREIREKHGLRKGAYLL